MKDEMTEQENTNIPEAAKPVETAAPVETEKPKGKRAKVFKALRIALDVVLYLFLAFSIFLLIVSLVSKRNPDGAVNLFGYEMRIVVSSSMEKSENSVDVEEFEIKDLPVKSMVFVRLAPSEEDEEALNKWYSELKVGDVLTFRYYENGTQETITHRIIRITPTETGYIIRLQGDNRASSSTNVSTQTIYTSPADYPNDDAMYSRILGKVVGNSVSLGHIVYSASQPLGIALIVIVPCAIIIVWQIARIVAVINEGKKKKATEAAEKALQEAQKEVEARKKQEQELEELKRKIAELERQKQGSDGGSGGGGDNGEQGGEQQS